MQIDAHVHFWEPRQGYDIGIMRKIGALDAAFTSADLRPLTTAVGIDAVVLVQASETVTETLHLLQLSEHDPLVAAVVGWADVEAGDFDHYLDRFQQYPKFRGIRALPAWMPDNRWLVQPSVKAGLRKLVARGLCLDLLINTVNLPSLLQLLVEIPELNVVINHGSRPSVMTGEVEPWTSLMRAVAETTEADVKLSGLIERAGVDWTKQSLEPFVTVLLDAFGPSRIQFASNWPVCTIMGTYAGWRMVVSELLDDLGVTKQERSKIFGGTAVSRYCLHAAN